MEPNVNALPILPSAPMAKDPVCGMNVNPAKAAAAREFGGKNHYFCSLRCAERFAKDPERFLTAPGTGGMQPATDATSPGHGLDRAQPGGAVLRKSKEIRYTCPMHPEVIQWGPGACP